MRLRLTELRIGSKVLSLFDAEGVLYEEAVPYTWQLADFEMLQNDEIDLDDFSARPISRETLMEFGFVSDIPFDDARPIYQLDDFYIDFDSLQPMDGGFPIAKKEISFVHELQNLYLSITGKTLD